MQSRLQLVSITVMLILICSATLTIVILNLSLELTLEIPFPFHPPVSIEPKISNQEGLGISDRIYVLSLPKRRDRREDMEVLRRALNLDWTYEDAHPADSGLVTDTLNWVASLRDEISLEKQNHSFTFAWPTNIDDIARSPRQIPLSVPPQGRLQQQARYEPLQCAIYDYDFPGNTTRTLPEYLILTPAKVACWHSHLALISQIANSNSTDDTAVGVILEDDVDMEEDIRQQVMALWPHLPTDWDIVFLGHCWSDESRGTALTPERSPGSRLYLSSGPQCTHAYALSRLGARRLLLHLQYPPFAYSRAIDQALSWLVKSGRLRSVSVVPSLVIQRRVSRSDIAPGVGSPWRDYLVHGVLDKISSGNVSSL